MAKKMSDNISETNLKRPRGAQLGGPWDTNSGGWMPDVMNPAVVAMRINEYAKYIPDKGTRVGIQNFALAYASKAIKNEQSQI
ncbi:MAG: hypothetical protein KGI33_08985 [Thaumarchaeota archaeon]|nr:hypothetical protein [Nitrososphaerota archaeon]